MGHFDELLAQKIGTSAIADGSGAASVTATAAGNGTCTLDGTDLVGTLTFANTWADADTVEVTFAKAKNVAPTVLLCNVGIGGTVNVDGLAVTATGFTVTASGTCAGDLQYLVIE